MEKLLVYPAGSTKASNYAAEALGRRNLDIVDHPTPEITHLLLDVPSFGPDGMLRGGGDLAELLRMLPGNVVIAGGNLNHPALAGYRTLDLLQDAEYLAVNAAITAECAMQVAANRLEVTYAGTSVLIIGWGRIGKCLARMLQAIGAKVTVAARKERDRGMLRALGFQAVDIPDIDLRKFQVVFNTAPEPVLNQEQTALCKNCLLVDLASKPGIEGQDVIWARGLPGIYAPESSGELIAETFLKTIGRK